MTKQIYEAVLHEGESTFAAKGETALEAVEAAYKALMKDALTDKDFKAKEASGEMFFGGQIRGLDVNVAEVWVYAWQEGCIGTVRVRALADPEHTEMAKRWPSLKWR